MHILIRNQKFQAVIFGVDMKTRILRSLSQATNDKTELNQTVLKLKKRFDEANRALDGKAKKK